jgi:hypothetical protein
MSINSCSASLSSLGELSRDDESPFGDFCGQVSLCSKNGQDEVRFDGRTVRLDATAAADISIGRVSIMRDGTIVRSPAVSRP